MQAIEPQILSFPEKRENWSNKVINQTIIIVNSVINSVITAWGDTDIVWRLITQQKEKTKPTCFTSLLSIFFSITFLIYQLHKKATGRIIPSTRDVCPIIGLLALWSVIDQSPQLTCDDHDLCPAAGGCPGVLACSLVCYFARAQVGHWGSYP